MDKTNNDNQNTHMKLWNGWKSVPQEMLKEIKDGPLAGMTDINPLWRMQALTEKFGPAGFGWIVNISERWESEGAGEKSANVKIELKIMKDGQWSMPIEGIGAAKLTGRGNGINDEAWKMATTDAISVACKALGIAADVYAGLQSHKNAKAAQPDFGTKYEPRPGQQAPAARTTPRGRQQPTAPQGYVQPQGPVQQPQQGWPQAAPMMQGFDPNNPAIAEAINRLMNFDKGTPTHQQVLNEAIGNLSQAGINCFQGNFIENITEAAQARREGRAPNFS